MLSLIRAYESIDRREEDRHQEDVSMASGPDQYFPCRHRLSFLESCCSEAQTEKETETEKETDTGRLPLPYGCLNAGRFINVSHASVISIHLQYLFDPPQANSTTVAWRDSSLLATFSLVSGAQTCTGKYMFTHGQQKRISAGQKACICVSTYVYICYVYVYMYVLCFVYVYMYVMFCVCI